MLLVAMAGLPGTGKSTLAAALAARSGGALLSKDTVRAALFEPADVAYEREQDDICFRAVLEAAAYLARAGQRPLAIVDGRTFSTRDRVRELRAFADGRGLALRVIECTCAPRVARERLERDAAGGGHPAGNRDFALHQRLARQADEIEGEKLVVRTDEGDLESLVDECSAWLAAHP